MAEATGYMKVIKTTPITILGNSFVQYCDHLGTDQKITNAARVSYNQGSKGEEQDKKLLRYLFKNKHTSPFEQVSITFNIRMPIFVMRQFVRHRTFRLNEVSARYTELDMGYYVPEKFRVQDPKNKQQTIISDDLDHNGLRQLIIDHSETSFNKYKNLLNAGIGRELARMVLPLNTLTEIIVNIDLNNLIKFFMLRDDSHAQWEIQEVARAMKEITRAVFPWTMEMYDELMEVK